MHSNKRIFLLMIGLSLVLFGCMSAATKQAIQSDYENALRVFNELPANAKECAPQEYARAEGRLAQTEEELGEEHWYYAKGDLSEVDTALRDTAAAVKRKCPPKAKKAKAAAPPLPVEKPTFVLEGIVFDFNRATIRSSSETTLQEAGSLMQRFLAMKVRIEGHTDSVGGDAYNQSLSERRANSVKEYLVTNSGVDPSRIDTVGYGEAKPIGDNETEDGRAQNRRISFVVTAQ